MLEKPGVTIKPEHKVQPRKKNTTPEESFSKALDRIVDTYIDELLVNGMSNREAMDKAILLLDGIQSFTENK